LKRNYTRRINKLNDEAEVKIKEIEASKSDNVKKIIENKVFLKVSKSDPHYGSGFTKQIIFSSEEIKDLREKYGMETFPTRVISSNKLINLFIKELKHVVNSSIQGDLLQGDHYGVKNEENKLTRIDEDYENFIQNKDYELFFDEPDNPAKVNHLIELCEKDPLNLEDLIVLDKRSKNLTNILRQVNRCESLELDFMKDFYAFMKDYNAKIGINTPLLILINGNHDQSATSRNKKDKTGIVISQVVAKSGRDKFGLRGKDKKLIRSGDEGSGLGVSQYVIIYEGIKTYYREVHNPRAKSINKLIEKAYGEQTKFNYFLSGHYHYWLTATSKNRMFISNGSTQSNTEFSLKYRFGPSSTIFSITTVPKEGPFENVSANIPITLDFAIDALLHPELLKNLKNTLDICGAEYE
jgi:hypothetical protein